MSTRYVTCDTHARYTCGGLVLLGMGQALPCLRSFSKVINGACKHFIYKYGSHHFQLISETEVQLHKLAVL